MQVKFELIALSEMWLQGNEADFFTINEYQTLATRRNSTIKQVTCGVCTFAPNYPSHKNRFDTQIRVPKCETLWVELDNRTVSPSFTKIAIGVLYR